jgi:hypothetical protein
MSRFLLGVIAGLVVSFWLFGSLLETEEEVVHRDI